MADEITIELILDGKKVKGTLKAVEKQSEKSGEKAGREFGKKLASSAASAVKVGMVAVAAAMGTAVFAAKKFTEAAIQQDEAVELLNANLRNMGKFSLATSKSLQAFAAEIERTTTFGDEAVLQQIAFAQSMGATIEQSKKMTLAAIELSVAQKKDLSSSMLQISKTLSGLKGELGETVKEIRVLTVAELEAGMAADVILKKFSGFSEAAATTFKGRLDQLSNSYGTLLENIGFVITKTPAFNAAITGMKNSIDAMATSFDPQNMAMKVNEFVETLLVLSHDIVTMFVSPLEKAFTRNKVILDEFVTAFKNMGGWVGGILEGLETRFFDFSFGLKGWWEAIEEVVGQRSDALAKAMAKTGVDDQALTNELLGSINDLRIGYQTATAEYILNEQAKATATSESLSVRAAAEAAFEEHNEMLRQKRLKAEEAAKLIGLQNIEAINGAWKQFIAKTIVRGTQVLMENLIAGQNAFKGFGKLLLGLLGDVATQIGQMLILIGTGMLQLLSNPVTAGFGAIAAGVGLVALGALMKSFAGGGGDAAGAASAGGGGIGADVTTEPPFTPGEELTSLNEEDAMEPSQNVTLNVHGNIFDSSETGTRLVEILNEEFSNKGSRLLVT